MPTKKGVDPFGSTPVRGTAQFIVYDLRAYQRVTTPNPYMRPCMMLFGARYDVERTLVRDVADDRVRVVDVEHLERRQHLEAAEAERARDLEVELHDALHRRLARPTRACSSSSSGRKRRGRHDDLAGRAGRRAVRRVARRAARRGHDARAGRAGVVLERHADVDAVADFLGARHLELRPPRNVEREVVAQARLERRCRRSSDRRATVQDLTRSRSTAMPPLIWPPPGMRHLAVEAERLVDVLALGIEGVEVAGRPRGARPRCGRRP